MTAGFIGALDQTQSKEHMRSVLIPLWEIQGRHIPLGCWVCVLEDSGVELLGSLGQGVPVPLPWPFLHRRSLRAVPWCVAVPLGTLLSCALEEPRDGMVAVWGQPAGRCHL